MAHHLATDATGKARFASLRENAWHVLGTVVSSPMSGFDFLTAAKMDFTIKAIEMTANGIVIPDRKAIFRQDTDGTSEYLGSVGNDYHVLQNTDMIDIFENMAKGGSIQYETAGALFKGEMVWILARIPEIRFSVKNEKRGFGVQTDDSIPYMAITSGHIGNQALTVAPVVTRIVCANTMRMARREWSKSGQKKSVKGSVYSIRHTAKMAQAIKEMEAYFQKMIEDFKWNNEMHNMLAQVEVTESQKKEFFNFVVDPAKDESEKAKELSKHKSTRIDNKLDILNQLWESPTNQMEATKGTAYALWQTGVEFIDHEKATRVTEGNQENELRLHSANYGQGADQKMAMLEKVCEMAGVG